MCHWSYSIYSALVPRKIWQNTYYFSPYFARDLYRNTRCVLSGWQHGQNYLSSSVRRWHSFSRFVEYIFRQSLITFKPTLLKSIFKKKLHLWKLPIFHQIYSEDWRGRPKTTSFPRCKQRKSTRKNSALYLQWSEKFLVTKAIDNFLRLRQTWNPPNLYKTPFFLFFIPWSF